MTGVWNVASDMETERENGPDQDGKMWQMWQGISGSCHRNISELQHVTRPLQGGKGFPVFPERKGGAEQKTDWKSGKTWLETGKTFLIIHSKDTYLLGKQYVSFDQTIRMLCNIHFSVNIPTNVPNRQLAYNKRVVKNTHKTVHIFLFTSKQLSLSTHKFITWK